MLNSVVTVPALMLATPSIADPHPDAALLELGRRWQTLQAAADDGERVVDRLSTEHEAQKPTLPDALRHVPADIGYPWGTPDSDSMFYMPADVRALRRQRCLRVVEWRMARDNDKDFILRDGERVVAVRYQPWPEAQARADEIVAAFDTFNEAYDRCEAEFAPRIATAEAEHDRICNEKWELERGIFLAEPFTAEGAAVVARVALHQWKTERQNSDEQSPADWPCVARALANSIVRIAEAVPAAPMKSAATV